MSDYEIELQTVQELDSFLQGNIPEGYRIPEGHMPVLSSDQAATVIWYLGNLYRKISDRVERCEVCGKYYHRWLEGEVNDHPPGPVFSCGDCVDSPAVVMQRRIGRKLEKHRGGGTC